MGVVDKKKFRYEGGKFISVSDWNEPNTFTGNWNC